MQDFLEVYEAHLKGIGMKKHKKLKEYYESEQMKYNRKRMQLQKVEDAIEEFLRDNAEHFVDLEKLGCEVVEALDFIIIRLENELTQKEE